MQRSIAIAENVASFGFILTEEREEEGGWLDGAIQIEKLSSNASHSSSSPTGHVHGASFSPLPCILFPSPSPSAGSSFCFCCAFVCLRFIVVYSLVAPTFATGASFDM